MTDKSPVTKKGFTADWLLQGALARIGDALDRVTGRRWTPSSSLATSELIERLKKLLDSEVVEVPGKGPVVPHNIRLKMQWDKFSTDGDESIKMLENELLIAAADHINDSLYYTYAPLNIEVKPDYFTEGVKLFVSFEKVGSEEHEAELNVTIPSINLQKEPEDPVDKLLHPLGITYVARFTIKDVARERRLEFEGEGRRSVGRTGSNALILDDASVSKIHASLRADAEGNLSVADTGSTNGTFVNGERIAYGKAINLVVGDHVKFGSVEVVFERLGDPRELSADGNECTPSEPSSKIDTDQVSEPGDDVHDQARNEVGK